jgi:hypothetical protein
MKNPQTATRKATASRFHVLDRAQVVPIMFVRSVTLMRSCAAQEIWMSN